MFVIVGMCGKKKFAKEVQGDNGKFLKVATEYFFAV